MIKNRRGAPGKNFCMAPWTHTHLTPQGERRLCCASRENSSFVNQYIDRGGNEQKKFAPPTLEEHWNSEHLKSVRKRMLNDEELPECEVCRTQSLNLFTYQMYFTERLFPHLIKDAIKNTDEDGTTTLKPISFDYRFSNRCSFKCRMCGPQLSSAWEAEERKHNKPILQYETWMQPEVRKEIQSFQEDVAEKEFVEAIEDGRLREIYWVGGEPLSWSQHWEYMDQIVSRGIAKEVFVRYNTNLSEIVRGGVHLFDDLLPHFKDYNVCASIDAAGNIGEYVRTGLNWSKWVENFKQGLAKREGREDSMVMDLTLTLPGLFGLKGLVDLAKEHDVKMYVKLMHAFDGSKILSPMALPREIISPILDDLIDYCEKSGARLIGDLTSTLKSMKDRQNFYETYPQGLEKRMKDGKNHILRLESVRGPAESGGLTMEAILSESPDALNWWRSI